MSKKHFVAMAKAISSMPDMESRQAAFVAFATIAAKANKNFDRTRFREACGL